MKNSNNHNNKLMKIITLTLIALMTILLLSSCSKETDIEPIVAHISITREMGSNSSYISQKMHEGIANTILHPNEYISNDGEYAPMINPCVEDTYITPKFVRLIQENLILSINECTGQINVVFQDINEEKGCAINWAMNLNSTQIQNGCIAYHFNSYEP